MLNCCLDIPLFSQKPKGNKKVSNKLAKFSNKSTHSFSKVRLVSTFVLWFDFLQILMKLIFWLAG